MAFIIANGIVQWDCVHKQNLEHLLRPFVVTAIVSKRKALQNANLSVDRNAKEQSYRARLTDVAINNDICCDQADV